MDFKMNNKVTTRSTGYTGSKFKPDLVGYEKRKRIKEQESVMESSVDPKAATRRDLYNKLNNNTISSIKEREIMNENYHGAKLAAFKAFMFEGFINSLYLDKKFKEEHAQEIYNVMESYIDGNGGYKLLENAPKTKFIKQLMESCEEIGKDCCKKDSEGQCEKQDWNKPKWNTGIYSDLKAKVEKDINKMSFDTLAKLVKDKVLTVVQDEKKRSEVMKEFEEDVNNQVDSALEESINLRLHSTSPVKVPTLWEALMTESYKAILNEGVTFFALGVNNGIGINPDYIDDSDEEIHWDSEDEKDIDDAFTADKFDQHKQDDGQNIDHESAACCESAGKSVNMDHVMCEALTKYTLIEFMNTAQFTNLKSNDVRKMAMHLTYDK